MKGGIVNMRKKNPWLIHLGRYRKSHPKISLTQAMRGAKKTYKKKK